MQINQLKYFITIADQKSMKKAASLLEVTPSSLSQFLRKLETSLGQPLFLRPNKKTAALSLTPAGIRYYQYCKEHLHLWTEAEDRLAALRSRQPRSYRIGSSGSYFYLHTFIPKLQQTESASDAKLDFVFDTAPNLQNRLLMGELDLVLGAYYHQNPSLQYEQVLSRELDLCTAADHPLGKYSYMLPGNEDVRLPISRAKEYPFILLRPGSVSRTQIDEYFMQHDFRPVSVENVQRSDDILIKLRYSNCVGFLPIQANIPAYLRLITLDPPIFYKTGAIYRKGYTIPPVLRRVIECYYSYYHDLPQHPQLK